MFIQRKLGYISMNTATHKLNFSACIIHHKYILTCHLADIFVFENSVVTVI
jgi:hypothetical protein